MTAAPAVFVLLWSSAFIAGVIGVGAAQPLWLTLWRLLIAGAVMTTIAIIARAPWPRGRRLLHVMITGLLIQAVQFGALYSAMGMGMPAAVVALVQGLNPVVIALLAGRFLGERVTGRQWVGFGLGAVGVVLAVADRLSFSGVAVVLCVVGLLGLSMGTLYQKRFVPDLDVRSGTAIQFLTAAPVVGVAALLSETPRIDDWGGFWGALAWLVVVNSMGVFVLLNIMLRRSSASRVSTLFFLTPSVTALLAWIIVGQALHPLAVLGMLVGGAGVLLAARR